MSGQSSRVAGVILIAVIASLSASAPAYALAVSPQSTTRVPGLNNWQPLAAGQAVEWVFQYNGNNDPALVAFGADPAAAIAVNVYDDGQWRRLTAGDTSVVPVGRGTAGTAGVWNTQQKLIDSGQLFWEAKARPAVTFHIQVANATQQPVQYWIVAAGTGAGSLTLVAPAPAVQPAAAAQAGGQPAAAAALTQPVGARPLTLPVSGGAALPALGGAGLALSALGWLLRRRIARGLKGSAPS